MAGKAFIVFSCLNKRFLSNHHSCASLPFDPSFSSSFYSPHPPINNPPSAIKTLQSNFPNSFRLLIPYPAPKPAPLIPFSNIPKNQVIIPSKALTSRPCEQYIPFQEQNHYHQADIQKIITLSASQYPRSDIHQKLQRQGPRLSQPQYQGKRDCNGVDFAAQNEENSEQLTNDILSVDMEPIMATF